MGPIESQVETDAEGAFGKDKSLGRSSPEDEPRKVQKAEDNDDA